MYKDTQGAKKNVYILSNKMKRNCSLHLGNSLYKNLKSTYIENQNFLDFLK